MSATANGLPGGPRGQLLAVGLTVVVLAVLLAGIVSPALGWYGARQERLRQRETLASRMVAVAATAPALQAQSSGIAVDPRASFVEGATEAVASAVLQQRLQEMSDRIGVRMTSVEVLAAEPAGAYRRIRVHAAVSGPWARLVALLAEIERTAPRMLVDELQIGQTRLITTEAVKPLDASFTIIALYAGKTEAK